MRHTSNLEILITVIIKRWQFVLNHFKTKLQMIIYFNFKGAGSIPLLRLDL